MGLADFGITEGRGSYIALRGCYPNGINWLRKSIGSLVEIDDGIPHIVKANKTLAQNQELIEPYEARAAVAPLLKERITSLPFRIREEHFVDVEDAYYPVTSQGEGI